MEQDDKFQFVDLRQPFNRLPYSLVKKRTTGCAGGKKEFHLWMEKENLQ